MEVKKLGKERVKKIEVIVNLNPFKGDLRITGFKMIRIGERKWVPPKHQNLKKICFHIPPPGGIYQCQISANNRGTIENHKPQLNLDAKNFRWSWKGLDSKFVQAFEIKFHTASTK